jgi:hypothetical protein
LLWVLDTHAGPRRWYEAIGWTIDGAQQAIELAGAAPVARAENLSIGQTPDGQEALVG